MSYQPYKTKLGTIHIKPVDMNEVRKVSAEWQVENPPPEPPLKRVVRLSIQQSVEVDELAKTNRISRDKAEEMYIDGLPGVPETDNKEFVANFNKWYTEKMWLEIHCMVFAFGGVRDEDQDIARLLMVDAIMGQALYKAIQSISELVDWILVEEIEKLGIKWRDVDIVWYWQNNKISKGGGSGTLVGRCRLMMSDDLGTLAKFDTYTPRQIAALVAPRIVKSWEADLRAQELKPKPVS